MGQVQPDDAVNASADEEVTSSSSDRWRRPTDPTEKEILMEGLGRPLQALRHQAGKPTYAVMAEKTRLSPSTLDNVFNGRNLISSDNLVAIAKYLGDEREKWIKRWVDTSTRLNTYTANRSAAQPPSIPGTSDDAAAQSQAAAPPPTPSADPAPTQEHTEPLESPPATDGPAGPPAAAELIEDSAAPRRQRVGLVVASVLGGSGALIGLLALALHIGSATATPTRPGGPPAAGPPTSPPRSTAPNVSAANGRKEPVAGQPVYKQCDTTGRSMLSEPGRDRGGEPRGKLMPGERFVVTAKTRYWKYGQVVGDPNRKGWVMSVYLCAVPGQTPGP